VKHIKYDLEQMRQQPDKLAKWYKQRYAEEQTGKNKKTDNMKILNEYGSNYNKKYYRG